ncbi:hypothetical protein QEL93_002784 [Pseudomonas putida]|nr:hypothetical protein [Pseudomonas putida]
MNGKRIIWYCWGVFDALLVAQHVITTIANGGIPFISGLLQISAVMESQGGWFALYFLARWALLLSILVSCGLFLAQRDSVKWLVWLQSPARVLFFMPSVSLISLYPGYTPSGSPALFLAVVVACEVLKLWSLWFFGTRKVARAVPVGDRPPF